MTKDSMSPAAQAVLDAYRNPHIYKNVYALAAALQAAADRVVPETQARTARAAQQRLIRQQLLAIASELEGSNG